MKKLLTNKKLLIVILVLFITTVFGIKIYFPKKEVLKEKTNNTDTKIEDVTTGGGQFLLPVGITDKNELTGERTQIAASAKNKIADSLPIYIEGFKTSNNRSTTLNVYTIPEDPDYLLHIEIYGIDYHIQNTDLNANPDAVAFIDSFNEIKKILKERGVNIKNLIFVFSGREYIQETAELWVDTFKLLQ